MTRIQEAKQLIERLLHFLKTYTALRDGHMVDYFINSLYDRSIPNEIREEITKIGYENVVKNILARNDHPSTPNLNEYINTAKSFSLYRTSICLSFNDFKEELRKLGKDESGVKLNVFMTSKKAHEVEVLSAVAATVSKISGTSHLVDIGDGKGYLSSLLALHHKIPVLGVDACYVNTDSAVKRVSKMEKHWHHLFNIPKDSEEYKSLWKNSMLYKQVTQVVTEDTDFDALIKNVFLDDCVGIGLVGLHTCGNLGPSSIRIFNSNQKIKSICNVSCCYHLLNEKYLPNMTKLLNTDDDKQGGFPMSAFLASSDAKLGRCARMLSAQSIDRILANQDLPNKIIFYRAIFEVVIKDNYKGEVVKNVGKFRKEPIDFVEYSREALRRLGVSIGLTDMELADYYEKFKIMRVQLNVFHLIRSMLAPVVESLILLDRYLFLLEQGHENVFLVQLFDPVISPRCYGLIAFKS